MKLVIGRGEFLSKIVSLVGLKDRCVMILTTTCLHDLLRCQKVRDLWPNTLFGHLWQTRCVARKTSAVQRCKTLLLQSSHLLPIFGV